MKKLLLTMALAGLIGCSADRVTTPDHKKQIDSNTARILLLEASQTLQNMRLDALEAGLESTNILVLSIQSTQIDIVNLLESLDFNDDDDDDDNDDMLEDLEDLRDRVADLEDIVDGLLDGDDGDSEDDEASCSINSVEESNGNNVEVEITCGNLSYTFSLHNVEGDE